MSATKFIPTVFPRLLPNKRHLNSLHNGITLDRCFESMANGVRGTLANAYQFFHSERNSVQLPFVSSYNKQNMIGVSLKERSPQPRATNVCIKLKSYDQPLLENWELPPSSKRIGLPRSRVLYTVLRSPHIDKKSREQFEKRINKMVIKIETNELHKKFFWLKRQRIFGAQCEILVSCKTRLDKERLQRLI